MRLILLLLRQVAYSPDKYQQTPAVKERVGLGIELGLGLIAFRVSRKDV